MAALQNLNELTIEHSEHDALSEQEEENKMTFQVIKERLKGRRKSVFLMEQITQTQQKLKEKEDECLHLYEEKDQTVTEIQELTAVLFEEANKMIQEATLKRMSAEKKVKETEGEIEALKGEVTVLKKIIQNSSISPKPSTALSFLSPSFLSLQFPNPGKPFTKGHRRANSNCTLSTPAIVDVVPIMNHSMTSYSDSTKNGLFVVWKNRSTLDQSDAFISDLIKWDISPCLEFPNKELSIEIFTAIFENQLFVEPLNKLAFENYCHLCMRSTECHYKVSFQQEQSNTIAISTFARNRVISVCSLVSYLRYVTLGMVKLQDHQMYTEILNLLKIMCLARLGLSD